MKPLWRRFSDACKICAMGPGPDGRRSGWKMPPQAQMRGLLIGGAFCLLAFGLTRVSAGGDAGDELASPLTRTASGDENRAGIAPSQPAVAVRFSPLGEIIRPAPEKARIIDPETGEELLITLPPGTTVVEGEVVPVGAWTTGPWSSGSTLSGTSTTGSNPGGTSSTITKPSGTTTTTTEPPTTTTTTEPPTTTEAPPVTDPPGGSLGDGADVLG